METLIKLSALLSNAMEYSWEDCLYLPNTEIWDLDSDCAILNLDDLADDEEDPEFAIKNNLKYALDIQQVQDIVANATDQNPKCSLNQLLEAFLFYYTNDAFLIFKKSK